MTSEKLGELVRGKADAGQNATECPLGDVPPRVYWHGDGASVRVAHYVMATVNARDKEASALQSPDDLRSRYGWDAARHKPQITRDQATLSVNVISSGIPTSSMRSSKPARRSASA
jgi:hypothetical protein